LANAATNSFESPLHELSSLFLSLNTSRVTLQSVLQALALSRFTRQFA
jgi:hypothetical protein